MEQNVEQVVRLRHAQEVLEQGQMPGAGDRQKFSDALDHAQDDGHDVRHSADTSVMVIIGSKWTLLYILAHRG